MTHAHMPTRVRRLPFPLGQTRWDETAWAPGHAMHSAHATAWALRPLGHQLERRGYRPPLAVVEIVPGGVRYQYAFTSQLGGRFLHEGEVRTVVDAWALVKQQLRRHVTMGAYWHAWSNLRRDPPMLGWLS